VIPIIAFGGASQTGKTTLGRRLAAHCHSKFVSFGDYVRQQAHARGLLHPTRQDLQDLGQQLVDSDINLFCQEVLNTVKFSPGQRLVVDGIRHTEALRAISQISGGQPIKLVYLHAPMTVRESRYQHQDSLQVLHATDAHPVESQTNKQVKDSADLILDASSDLDTSFVQILAWVNRECHEWLTAPPS